MIWPGTRAGYSSGGGQAMIDRRNFNLGAAATAGMVLMPTTRIFASPGELNEDGLHIQPWFMESFLDLREDYRENAAAGKLFAVLWEQRGCPYCRELHRINFQKKQIVDYITSKFGILQLNLWGSRKVTDFDGEELEERDLARKWAVNFTPTTVFFGKDIPEGKSGRDAEVARMPGYFKPFHFLSMLEFVQERGYENQGFQQYLQAKLKDMKAKGIKPEIL